MASFSPNGEWDIERTGDVADALVTLAQQKAAGRVPDVGGPEALTLDALAETYLSILHKQRAIRTHCTPGAYFDAFRSDEKLVPERAVGHSTWEQFLHQAPNRVRRELHR